MLLKYFYDQALAHASYLVGCQKADEAIVVDPGRDIQIYLDAAANEGMNIVGAVETHIHADFVSGSRELAERVGAKLFLSDGGPAEWKYAFAADYESQLLTDQDCFYVGEVKLKAIHTPGHTPEHLCFQLIDEGGGATEPMGMFTGDFVFVNSLGRPDLLETAAGVTGSADESARDLFRSAQKFKQLPDQLQIWPAHGAGSACGKGLGSIPSSTVGYEKAFNPGLQFGEEQPFVDYILSDQPETPRYFKIMKRVNKEGPSLLADLQQVETLGLTKLTQALDRKEAVIDTRNRYLFASGHVPGSIFVPTSRLGSMAGWLIDYENPVYLIAEDHERDEVVRVLQKIGIDTIAGIFDACAVANAGMNTQSFPNRRPKQVSDAISSGEVRLVDVRGAAEWDQGRIPEAERRFLGTLDEEVSAIEPDRPVVLQCGTGVRSTIAASILQSAGIEDVVNLDGGITAWEDAGLPIVSEQPAAVGS